MSGGTGLMFRFSTPHTAVINTVARARMHGCTRWIPAPKFAVNRSIDWDVRVHLNRSKSEMLGCSDLLFCARTTNIAALGQNVSRGLLCVAPVPPAPVVEHHRMSHHQSPRDMPHRLQRRKLLPQKCLNGFSPPQVRRRNHFSSSSTFLLVEVASRKPPSPKSCVRPCLCRTSLFITCKTRP